MATLTRIARGNSFVIEYQLSADRSDGTSIPIPIADLDHLRVRMLHSVFGTVEIPGYTSEENILTVSVAGDEADRNGEWRLEVSGIWDGVDILRNPLAFERVQNAEQERPGIGRGCLEIRNVRISDTLGLSISGTSVTGSDIIVHVYDELGKEYDAKSRGNTFNAHTIQQIAKDLESSISEVGIIAKSINSLQSWKVTADYKINSIESILAELETGVDLSNLVTLNTPQTITGAKIFTAPLIAASGSFTGNINAVSGIFTGGLTVAGAVAVAGAVKLSSGLEVTGLCIFNTGILMNMQRISNLADGTLPQDAVTKAQLDAAITGSENPIDLSNFVTLDTTQIIKGRKGFGRDLIVYNDGDYTSVFEVWDAESAVLFRINPKGTVYSTLPVNFRSTLDVYGKMLATDDVEIRGGITGTSGTFSGNLISAGSKFVLSTAGATSAGDGRSGIILYGSHISITSNYLDQAAMIPTIGFYFNGSKTATVDIAEKEAGKLTITGDVIITGSLTAGSGGGGVTETRVQEMINATVGDIETILKTIARL